LGTNTPDKQDAAGNKSFGQQPDKAKPAEKSKTADKPKIAPTVKDSFAAVALSGDFGDWIQKYISENRLVRILVNRNGERMSIPCRILNFQSENYAINVYHVDEKQVYTFMLSEVIDFMET